MKRNVGLFVIGVVAVFAIVGCGGGGGASGSASPGTASITAPSRSLQGTYSFVGFDVNYSNGTIVVNVNENSPEITSWSGTMEFGTNTLSQSFDINNNSIGLTGTVTITWITEGVAGVAHITDASGTHNLSFTISGDNFITYSGVIPYGSPALTVEEYHYWLKVSDSVSPDVLRSVTETSDPQAYTGKYWVHESLEQ